jgi:predicted RNA polymerase sigma factor
MRLCILLTENELSNTPETQALMALMCYNASRFDARIDNAGFIVLLQDQDRSKWNKELIQKGHQYLGCASSDGSISTYHLEAAISSRHCVADSFEQTDWETILNLYTLLAERNPSPVVLLNRAIAMSFARTKLEAIEEIKKLTGLHKHYLYNAALGDLYFETGQAQQATFFYLAAIKQTNNPQEQELLKKKLAMTTSASN